MISITGATGFIGSYVADRLPFPQRRITRQAHPSQRNATWIKGDLGNPKDIENLVKDTSILIHFACSSTPRSSNQNFLSDIQQNLASSISLFETFAKTNPGGHIIFSSTGGNMYDAISATPHTEQEIPAARSSYAVHKLAIENYLRLICSLYGIRGTILRMSNPYGTLLSSQRPQGLIGVAFAKLIAQEPLDVFDSVETVRDYIHLDDVVQAYQIVAQKPPQIGECRLFNIGFGLGHSIHTVLEMIEKVSKRNLKKKFLNKEISPTYSVLSYDKIHKELGWKPKISLEEGIHRMWQQEVNH